MKRVFLGGTCADSSWRQQLIPMLKIEYFDPVVSEWTPECMAEEIRQRETCDYCLYVITPRSSSTYSIAEVVDDSNKRPFKTISCILSQDGDKEFTRQDIKHLGKVMDMVKNNGGTVCSTLAEVAEYLNK
jgi:hypothetical protein